MKSIKLFWIDDVETWSASACENLKIIDPKYGIDLSVVFAANGEDVCQKLMMFDFDGVIMDYHMEPFRGNKYIEDIRFEEHLDNIPIIFYSQDNSTNISTLVSSIRNIITVYRPNLEDKIKELFFKV